MLLQMLGRVAADDGGEAAEDRVGADDEPPERALVAAEDGRDPREGGDRARELAATPDERGVDAAQVPGRRVDAPEEVSVGAAAISFPSGCVPIAIE